MSDLMDLDEAVGAVIAAVRSSGLTWAEAAEKVLTLDVMTDDAAEYAMQRGIANIAEHRSRGGMAVPIRRVRAERAARQGLRQTAAAEMALRAEFAVLSRHMMGADGTMRALGQFSVSDWEARADISSKHAAGWRDSADTCLAVISELHASKKTCVDDLPLAKKLVLAAALSKVPIE